MKRCLGFIACVAAVALAGSAAAAITVSGIGCAGIGTSSNQVSITTTGDADAGKWVVVSSFYANTATGNINSATDSAGNNWGTGSFGSTSQITVTSVGRVRMFAKKLTSTIPTGGTITVQMSVTSASAKFACAAVVTGGDLLDQNITGTNGSSTSPSPGAIPVSGTLASPNEVIFLGYYSGNTISNRDGYTQSGSYVVIGNQTMGLDYKVVSSNAQTTPTYTQTSAAWGMQALSFTEAVAGVAATRGLLGVGR